MTIRISMPSRVWMKAGIAAMALGLSGNAMAQDSAAEDLAQDATEALEAETNEVPASIADYWTVDADAAADPENVWLLDLSNGGRVAIRLKPQWAPEHVERIKTLTQQGFYDGVIFHRVIEGFMAQSGDPSGTGRGGSELPDLKEEFNRVPHLRGTVSMARMGNSVDSANSQFFIVFYPTMAIDGKYTVFGRVIGGMDKVDAITRGEPPANPTRIVQASLASQNKPAPAPMAAPAQEITADMLNNAVPDSGQ
ncbi:peptidylprolyl isomerase [Croceicoccus marinus]|jgi:peptidylprolyl isomerase|nr:peptidylprolyl isomerase [Croceicoccus marinus]